MEQHVKHEVARAKKLLSSLCRKYCDVVVSDYGVDKIEWCRVNIGAPRLRFVAEYLINDTPWLKIPKADRNAIAEKAAKARVITFDRYAPPIEIVDELQELVRLGKALSRMHPGDIDIKLPAIRARFACDNDALRKWWVDLGERLVIKRRPEQYKDKAELEARGRTPPETWCRVALEELAAMRLMHDLPPEDAHEKFSELYAKTKASVVKSGAHGIHPGSFRGLRRASIQTFRDFFHTDEKPRHAETLTKRKRGNKDR